LPRRDFATSAAADILANAPELGLKVKKLSSDGPPEERVIWRERFQAEYFDFQGKSIFTRFDGCEFVKCTLLIDHGTEQLAFTACVFKDCNIDKLEQDEERGYT